MEGGSQVNVREGRRDDLADIVRIYNQAVVGDVATFDLEPVTVEEREGWFAQFGAEHPLLVAEAEGRVAGFAYYLPYRARKAYARTKECTVYIDEALHGRGAGTALYEELIRRARAGRVHVLIGVIAGGNPGSIALHRKFGFTHAGTLDEVGWKFGRWVPTLFYQRILE